MYSGASFVSQTILKNGEKMKSKSKEIQQKTKQADKKQGSHYSQNIKKSASNSKYFSFWKN